MTEVTVKTKDGKKHTLQYEMGETLDAARQLFGDEVVYGFYHGKMVIWAADFARPKLEAGMPLAKVQAALDARKPGVAGPRGSKADPVASFLAKFAKMSQEEQLAALRQVKEVQRSSQSQPAA